MKTTDLFGRPLSHDRRQFSSAAVSSSSLRTRRSADIACRVEQGDCLEVMSRLKEEGVQCDACVTDPPYHMSAMNKRFSRVARNETGMPPVFRRMSKGFNGQTWDGGDVSFRPETWAAVAEVLRPGAFLLAFGGTRTYHRLAYAIEDAGFVVQDCISWLYGTGFPKRGDMLKPACELICLAYKPGGARTLQTAECGLLVPGDDEQARYPANVCHDGSAEVLELLPEGAGSGADLSRSCAGSRPGGFFSPGSDRGSGGPNGPVYDDSGSVARFFYTAKATAEDRQFSKHPTVKPISLMRWLIRLATPPGGVVLDPFAGTGSTGAAALLEGIDSLLIEREPEHVASIHKKLAYFKARRARALF